MNNNITDYKSEIKKVSKRIKEYLLKKGYLLKNR